MVRIHYAAIILAGLLMTGSGAQAQSEAAGKLSLDQRVWIAGKIYSSIQLYFAHWEAVPDLDLDSSYRSYIAQILGSDDRLSFDLASKEFMARLRNGHTAFYDEWLDRNFGAPLGFRLSRMSGRWVVTQSRRKDLVAGEVVESIGASTVDEYFAEKQKYIGGSSEADKRRRLFNAPWLFPEAFVLTLEGGAKVSVRRGEQVLAPEVPPSFEARTLEPGIAYLRIPAFDDPQHEKKAVEFLKQNAGARSVIIDVRGNTGGMTPNELIAALMDRPYRNFTSSTVMSIALFGAYEQIKAFVPLDQMGDRARGYVEALAGYRRPNLVTAGEVVQPDKPVYTGALFVLTDDRCVSACEDMVMPLKVSGRAHVIGQATAGSTGQPYVYDFGNGMSFRIGATRVLLPDGSEFEGVGLVPEVEVQPTPQELRAGVDPVLNKALALARGTEVPGAK